jgi:hypothetical protein
MLAEIFPMGSWKSIIEMENTLTLEELYLLRNAQYDTEHRRNKFFAALKGIDLDEQQAQNNGFDEVKRRAAADAAGMTEEAFVFNMIGIEIEGDDDD